MKKGEFRVEHNYLVCNQKVNWINVYSFCSATKGRMEDITRCWWWLIHLVSSGTKQRLSDESLITQVSSRFNQRHSEVVRAQIHS